MEEVLGLLKPVMEMGAFGLIVWLVRHVFTHTVPRLAESFDRQLTRSLDSFERIHREDRDAYREELRLKREADARSIAELTSAIERLNTILLTRPVATEVPVARPRRAAAGGEG